MRKLTIDLGGTKAGAELWDDKAPKTVAALLKHFPMTDRTIHVRWSGDAWRTEKNYPLEVGEVENRITWLRPGDIIYYHAPEHDLFKVAIAYRTSQWREPKGEIYVAHIGRVTDNLDGLNKASGAILFQGPLPVTLKLT